MTDPVEPRFKVSLNDKENDKYDFTDSSFPEEWHFEKNSNLSTKAWAVTNVVRDQDKCGSDWAFAATTAVEYQVALDAKLVTQLSNELPNSSHPLTLSSQMLLSCAKPDPCAEGNCNGNNMDEVASVLANKGLVLAHHMKYTSGDATTMPACPKIQDSWTTIKAGLHPIPGPRNNLKALLTALLDYGPLVVGVAAKGWAFYGSGVYDGKDDRDINHVAVLTGYKQPGVFCSWCTGEYHLRNSWGESWGENGNIRLRMFEDDDHPHRCSELKREVPGGNCKVSATTYVCGNSGILYSAWYTKLM
jgi:C1A family cysteine protease